MSGHPRILDTSALLLLFAGQTRLMELLDVADLHPLVMPTIAIAEAEAALGAGLRMWEHFLRIRSVQPMDQTEYTAIETGRLAGAALRAGQGAGPTMTPWMVGQTVWEAKSMAAPIVTQIPHAYDGHDVVLTVV